MKIQQQVRYHLRLFFFTWHILITVLITGLQKQVNWQQQTLASNYFSWTTKNQTIHIDSQNEYCNPKISESKNVVFSAFLYGTDHMLGLVDDVKRDCLIKHDFWHGFGNIITSCVSWNTRISRKFNNFHNAQSFWFAGNKIYCFQPPKI